jgi:hypothetical protein
MTRGLLILTKHDTVVWMLKASFIEHAYPGVLFSGHARFLKYLANI